MSFYFKSGSNLIRYAADCIVWNLDCILVGRYEWSGFLIEMRVHHWSEHFSEWLAASTCASITIRLLILSCGPGCCTAIAMV